MVIRKDKSRRRISNGSGMAIDATGNPAFDPSENVLALVEAAIKRLDDLLAAFDKLVSSQLSHLDEIGKLRAEHSKEIREIETKRLDAIRQVDVLAVSTAADRAQAAINTLAATTAADAAKLRDALTATATTIASSNANTVTLITERLAVLEKISYEGTGRTGGIGSSWGVIVAVAVAAISLGGFVVALMK